MLDSRISRWAPSSIGKQDPRTMANAARALSATPSHYLPPPHFSRPTYLMCPPQWYDVDYVINPWMAGNLHRSSRDRAFAQWRCLYDALHQIADVRVLHPREGSPDMTFVGHTALVQHGVAAISNFAHPQREAEAHHLRRWMADAGFLLWETPRESSFEGEGDVLFDPTGRHLWAAHGSRTCQHSHRHLASAWHASVTSLHLIDPRFFHLDTCFAPLAGGYLLYFPEAFDQSSLDRIHAAYPPHHRIAVTQEQATRFACNVINLDRHILMGNVGPALQSRLEAAGFHVRQIELSEFLRGGGSAKSLALRLSDVALSSTVA